MILPGLPLRVRSRPSCGRNACSAVHSIFCVSIQVPCHYSNMHAGVFMIRRLF